MTGLDQALLPTRRHGSDQHDVPATKRSCTRFPSDKEHHRDTITIVNLAAVTIIFVLPGLFIVTPDEFDSGPVNDTMPQIPGQRPW